MGQPPCGGLRVAEHVGRGEDGALLLAHGKLGAVAVEDRAARRGQHDPAQLLLGGDGGQVRRGGGERDRLSADGQEGEDEDDPQKPYAPVGRGGAGAAPPAPAPPPARPAPAGAAGTAGAAGAADVVERQLAGARRGR